MADYERPILAAEEKFFNECNTGNGKYLLAVDIMMVLIWLLGSACGCCIDKG